MAELHAPGEDDRHQSRKGHRHVNALNKDGWLIRLSGGGKRADGRGICNHYVLRLPEATVPVHGHTLLLKRR